MSSTDESPNLREAYQQSHERALEGREDYKLFVEPAPEPQTIACPGCGREENVLILPDGQVTGIYCRGCDGHITYVFSRTGPPEDDGTEQATLGFGEEVGPSDGGNA